MQAQQASNGTYTAKSITLTQCGPGNGMPNAAGQGQPPAGVAGCFGSDRGSKRSQGNGAVQANSQRRRILGTIGQITGTTLTVTDQQQNARSITLTSDTKVIQITSATTGAIQTGMGIRVIGQNNNGVITASSITIYDPRLLPTPTPSTT